VRWLVDGMNVIGTRPDKWWKDRHRAMVNLVDLLERWAAAEDEDEDVTVVFEQPPSPPIRSTVIEVAHAPRPRRDSADDEIVRLLLADTQPGSIRVVTSDTWLSDRVHAAGATVQPAAPFRAMIEEA
jgi:predicted RNA-binding protein with PIN domain